MIVIGLVPATVAYFEAKFFFAFRRRSALQIAFVAGGLVIMLGVLVTQGIISAWFTAGEAREFLRRITPFQYLAALIVFFWKLSRIRGKSVADKAIR
jgi:hypothetical protein